jgi:hypothetical protein
VSISDRLKLISSRQHKASGLADPWANVTAPSITEALSRYCCTLHLIGKETERGWEQAEDISTLLPSLMRYDQNSGIANQQLRERLNKMSLNHLQNESGLSWNTILRARRGQRVHPRSLQRLRIAASVAPG